MPGVATRRPSIPSTIAARTVTLIITDGGDYGSTRMKPADVKAIVDDMRAHEHHIVAAMGISDGAEVRREPPLGITLPVPSTAPSSIAARSPRPGTIGAICGSENLMKRVKRRCTVREDWRVGSALYYPGIADASPVAVQPDRGRSTTRTLGPAPLAAFRPAYAARLNEHAALS
jgi:hypothetical protein